MFEAVLLAVAALTLIGGGLLVWRLVSGPAQPGPLIAVRIAVVSLTTISLVTGAAWKLSKSRTYQLFGGIVSCVETDLPLVALTFDDGPTSEFTDEILTILREQDVRATFFVTGRELQENLAAGRRILAEGHELGNHSYSHAHIMLRSPSYVELEITRTDQVIRMAGFAGEIHFCSPFGKKLIVLPYYLRRVGRRNILFDVEPESYPNVADDANRIVDHVLAETHPGSIVLLHVMYPSRVESREALPGIIRGLRQRGYSFVTVSELLATQ